MATAPSNETLATTMERLHAELPMLKWIDSGVPLKGGDVTLRGRNLLGGGDGSDWECLIAGVSCSAKPGTVLTDAAAVVSIPDLTEVIQVKGDEVPVVVKANGIMGLAIPARLFVIEKSLD